ncbi:hypothetical protein Lal_00033352 [Lupinus albus]|nr:hypothetical protein Lal_00033352 [Lupinus albus]
MRIFIEAIDTYIWDIVQYGPYIQLFSVEEETKEKLRLNAYELIHMFPYEFIHIVNLLVTLDKVFANGDLTNKVLRCLDRKWQPKVSTIMESKDLDSMLLATLFRKLQEHDMKLRCLTLHE